MARRFASRKLAWPVLATIAVASAAAGLAGCESDDDDAYVQVCTDQNDNRVQEDLCDDDDDHWHWVYIPPGMSYPAYGQRTSGYVSVPPAGVKVSKPTSRTGGVAPARGGFGGRSGTTSGG